MLSIMTRSITIPSITTCSIMVPSIYGIFLESSIDDTRQNDTLHNDIQHNGFNCYTQYNDTQHNRLNCDNQHNDTQHSVSLHCDALLTVTHSVFILRVLMLNAVILSVAELSE
jgi:hypothetical protein